MVGWKQPKSRRHPHGPSGHGGAECRAGGQEGQDQDSGKRHPHLREVQEVSEKKDVEAEFGP